MPNAGMECAHHKIFVFRVRDDKQTPPEGYIEITHRDIFEAVKAIATLSPGIQIVELVMSYYPHERAYA